jgi:hypothetical protein
MELNHIEDHNSSAFYGRLEADLGRLDATVEGK